MPGLFVEHDDDFVGTCFDSPTPHSGHEGPMDEDRALKLAQVLRKYNSCIGCVRHKLNLAQVLMSTRGSKSPGDEKASSDKENELEDKKKKGKGGKQQQLKQKVSARFFLTSTEPVLNLLKVFLFKACPNSNYNVQYVHTINLSA